MLTHVTDEQFKEKVLNSTKVVLVDFWAEWCGPCRMLSPILDEISKEFGEKIDIAKIDIESNPNVPSEYGVRGIPALMLFKDGKLLDTKIGLSPKETLVKWINSNID
jgi:thioredoxin 1